MNYYKQIPFSQDPDEFAEFIEFAKSEHVESYLEIGARHGGSFLNMVERLPKFGKYVALDYPGGKWGKTTSQTMLDAVIGILRQRGYEDVGAHYGDSHDKDTIHTMSRHAPFDLIFIDADHSYDAVLKDFYNYCDMAPLVALHDINGKGQSSKKGEPVEVWKLWEELKSKYKYREIINFEAGFGIGIIWTSKLS